MAISSLVDTSASAGILLTAPGGANSEAAWTQLVASSAIAAEFLILFGFPATANGDALLDIGTGGSGSESVILQDIPSARTGVNPGRVGVFPISVPISTRIAARYQATSTSLAYRLACYLCAKDTVQFEECTSAVTYGSVAANSGGTSIDPGGSANTKGSYVEITAATSADIKWLQLLLGNQQNTARSNAVWLVDIATGAAGAESVVIPNLALASNTSSSLIMPGSYPAIPIEIASGTRIAIRAQCNITDATDRKFDAILVGYNGTHSSGAGVNRAALPSGLSALG